MHLPIPAEAWTCKTCGEQRRFIGDPGNRALRCLRCDIGVDSTLHWNVRDLLLLKDMGVDVDPLIEERVRWAHERKEQAYHESNMHRDFGDCHYCGAKPWEQHRCDCRRGAPV